MTLEATENESRVGAKNVPVQEPSEAEQCSGGTALQNQTEMLEKSGASAGGLASFLNQQQENNADGPADEVLSSGSDVVENSAVNNGVAGNDATGNRAETNGTEKATQRRMVRRIMVRRRMALRGMTIPKMEILIFLRMKILRHCSFKQGCSK